MARTYKGILPLVYDAGFKAGFDGDDARNPHVRDLYAADTWRRGYVEGQRTRKWSDEPVDTDGDPAKGHRC